MEKRQRRVKWASNQHVAYPVQSDQFNYKVVRVITSLRRT